MSHCILNGPGGGTQVVGQAQSQLSLPYVNVAYGITVIGNTFSFGFIGDYYVEAKLGLCGVDNSKAFTVTLFNETTGLAVGSYSSSTGYVGHSETFMFKFAVTVVNPAHVYSLRISAQGAGNPANMINIDEAEVLVTSFGAQPDGITIVQNVDGTISVPGAIGGGGTANRMPLFTAPLVIGDSQIYNSGGTIGLLGTTADVTSDANTFLKADNAVIANYTNAADTAGVDVHFRAQSGGADAGANPRGGDITFTSGAAGAGGVGRAGQIVSNGTVVLSDQAGTGAGAITTVAAQNLTVFPATTGQLQLSAAPTTADATSSLIIGLKSATDTFVVQAYAAQSANIFETQNSAGTPVFLVNSTGGVVIAQNTTIGINILLGTTGSLRWNAGGADTGISRTATAAVIEVNNGTRLSTGLLLNACGRISGNAPTITPSVVLASHSTDGVYCTITHTTTSVPVPGMVVTLAGWTWTTGAINGTFFIYDCPTTTTFRIVLAGQAGNPTVVNTVTVNAQTQLGAAATTPDKLADVTIGCSATTQKGLVIQAKAGVSANPFEIQTSVGANLFSVGSTGSVITPGFAGYFNSTFYTGTYFANYNVNIGAGTSGGVRFTTTYGDPSTVVDATLARSAAGILTSRIPAAIADGTAAGGIGSESFKNAKCVLQCVSEEVTVADAATTDSTNNLLPANAYVVGVTARVTVILPGAVTWKLGTAAIDDLFAEALQPGTAGQMTTSWNTGHAAGTGGPTAQLIPFANSAAAKIRITPSGLPGAATGKIRITVFYFSLTAPGS